VANVGLLPQRLKRPDALRSIRARALKAGRRGASRKAANIAKIGPPRDTPRHAEETSPCRAALTVMHTAASAQSTISSPNAE
jgi:hypothetical protein